MGILLPPITQVTTVTNTHLTLHHRNRSLDSALQRIPEVDVTPSPECENVNTILAAEGHNTCTGSSSATKTQRDELASLGSDDSGILCGSENGGNEELLAANANNLSRESLDSGADTCDGPEINQSTVKPECFSGDDNNDNVEGKKLNSDTYESVCTIKVNDEKTNVRDEYCKITVSDVSVAVPQTSASVVNSTKEISQAPKPSTGLLRLLESKVFDVPMAMHYLFKSKEPGVQSYIANRMFSFEDSEVDFYLPQLVCMYIQMHDVAEVIHPYLVHR